MESLEAEVLRLWPCQLGIHLFGGSAYRVDGREVAHMHGNGLVDVHLDSIRAASFVAAGQPSRTMCSASQRG